MNMDRTLSSLYRLRVGEYFRVSGLALVTLDHVLTWHREVRYVWRGGFNWPKVFIVGTRYCAIGTAICSLLGQIITAAPESDECKRTLLLATVFGGISVCFAQVILILRTYAIYGCNKKLLAVLSATFAIFLEVVGYVVFVNFTRDDEPNPVMVVQGCNDSHPSKLFIVEYIVILVFETIIALLTLRQWKKRARNVARDSLKISTLYYDGILYYIVLCLLSLANIIAMALLPVELSDIIFVFQPVLHSSLASRILFHIQTDWRDARNMDSTVSSGLIMSTLNFTGSAADEERMD